MASGDTLADVRASWSPEKPTMQEISDSMQTFSAPDYTVFGLMLMICGVIGFYFGFVKKQSGIDEYLVGGRNMKIIPVGLSLVASFISGIALLGTPTEVYVHGTSYLLITCGLISVGLAMSYIFLPIFHDLKLTSAYEYLELRFDNKIRMLGSVLFAINIMIWMPIVIYVPALAFNQVTGVNVHIVTPFVCSVCIFYTCVGGLRAVVWTDFIQTFMMFGSMILVVCKGTADLGGISVVLQRNLDSGRLEFPSTDWSPLERHTVWSLLIGGFAHLMHITAINQNVVQRYLSLPSLASAKRALWCFIFGTFILMMICGYAGMLISAWYHDCDPLTTKLAGAKDQLLSLLVMDILGDYPGLPGLFVAGVFSAALSSLSTGLNSMTAVVLEDFIKPFRKTPFTPKVEDVLMKVTTMVLGIICVALVFAVEKTSSHVLQLTTSLESITGGPSLGLFIMGMLLPWINAKGALVGGLFGLGFMGWMTLSAQAAIASGRIKFDEKPVSTEGCTYSFTQAENLLLFVPPESILNETNESFSEPWGHYRLSYLWYTMLGAMVTMSIGLVVSIISSEDVEKLDPRLLAPFLRKYIKTSSKNPQTIQVEKSDMTLEVRSDVDDSSDEATVLRT